MAKPKNPRGAKRLSKKSLTELGAKSPADEDLVIIAPDNQFFWVSKEQYRQHPFEVEEGDLYDHLMKAGVVLAQLPPNLEELPSEMGKALCMCFLVNLASVHAQTAQKKVPRLKRPSASTPGGTRGTARSKRTRQTRGNNT